jgi:hypothetical protein
MTRNRAVYWPCLILLASAAGTTAPLASQAAAPDTSFPATGIDFSGVDRFWTVADVIAHDGRPTPDQWRALLSTPAYRLVLRNLGPELQDGIDLALRPSRRAEFARATADESETSLALRHIALAYTRRAELIAYRDSVAGGTPIAEALAWAARYLPPGAARNGPPPLVTFAIFKDDGYSFPEGVVVDLLYARVLALGGTPLTANLAHEFHHSYVNRMAKPLAPGAADAADAGLRDALYNLRNEGIADQIDKPYPFHSPNPGLAAYAARYNVEYARTPAVLRQLDSLLVVAGTDPSSIGMAAMDLFWSNGHPNGAYIAREILETFGVDSIFPGTRSPAAFLRTFASAERKHGRPNPLSASAWRELDLLDTRYWRR